jgi:hypothetical protein
MKKYFGLLVALAIVVTLGVSVVASADGGFSIGWKALGKSSATAYLNPDSRDAGVIVWKSSADLPVQHEDWYVNNPAYVTKWYLTPNKPPDMTPWKEYCKKYGVDY